MNSLRKVLVVDNGHRGVVDPLASELSELGLSSVTTSFEAADDVLQIIDRPSAIFLKMPADVGSDHATLMALAASLRSADRTSGIPVIMWDRQMAATNGGITAILRNEVGPQAVSGPEV